jgi:hypothetical protein
MRVFISASAVALALMSTLCFSIVAAAQQSDESAAQQVLGPQWKQLSRRAGMIFAGTVLTAAAPAAATDRDVPRVPMAIPAIQLSFRVDRPIAGVDPGQILTIHEWTGAYVLHRPMRSGQHILIFLYRPSRLGLTSPVGGSLGQILLDSTGINVSSSIVPYRPARAASVTQLERAIRSARKSEQE